MFFLFCFYGININAFIEPVVGSSFSTLSPGFSSRAVPDLNVYKEIKLGNLVGYIDRNIFDSHSYYFISSSPSNNVSIYIFLSDKPFHITSYKDGDMTYFVNDGAVNVYSAQSNSIFKPTTPYFYPIRFGLNSNGSISVEPYKSYYSNMIKMKGYRSNFGLHYVTNVGSFLGKPTYDVVVKNFFPPSLSVLQGLETAPTQLGGTVRNLVQAMLPVLMVVVVVMGSLIFLGTFFRSLETGLEEFSEESEME